MCLDLYSLFVPYTLGYRWYSSQIRSFLYIECVSYRLCTGFCLQCFMSVACRSFPGVCLQCFMSVACRCRPGFCLQCFMPVACRCCPGFYSVSCLWLADVALASGYSVLCLWLADVVLASVYSVSCLWFADGVPATIYSGVVKGGWAHAVFPVCFYCAWRTGTAGWPPRCRSHWWVHTLCGFQVFKYFLKTHLRRSSLCNDWCYAAWKSSIMSWTVPYNWLIMTSKENFAFLLICLQYWESIGACSTSLYIYFVV